ncbi:MAG: phage tail terminator protein [Paracoccaceae bacterium]
MLDAVADRLKAQVPALNTRVEDAAAFAALMRTNKLSPAPLSAYVLPLGLAGKTADAATGLFRQSYAETIGVVLVVRGADPQGQRALENVRPLIMSCIEAIAGWAPGDEVGVFQLSRGALLNMRHGTLFYQLDFSINDQLRIPT